MKNILFIAFSSFIFLFVSCTSEQETETYIPIDEIIPLDTHLIPNKDTKIVKRNDNPILSFEVFGFVIIYYLCPE